MNEETGLASAVNSTNWRTGPFNRWSFRNVDKVIPSSPIHADPGVAKSFEKFSNEKESLVLNAVSLNMLKTDAVVALIDGKIAYEWYANGNDEHTPHILMSATKAVMGLLAGILNRKKALSLTARVTEYLPEMSGTVYANASLRDLLDMRSGVVLNETQQRAYEDATNWNGNTNTGTGSDLYSFFKSLVASPAPTGGSFHYNSANTDLLGWAIERATGQTIAELLSLHLWQPMGAQNPAYVTLDRAGLARTAGGLCATARDFARLGQLIVDNGCFGATEIIPKEVIDDIYDNGDAEAWKAGEWAKSFAAIGKNMNYRSGWYIVNDEPQTLFAMGIHGQNLFIDRKRKLVVAKLSSWAEPTEIMPIYLTHRLFGGFQREHQDMRRTD